MIRSATPIYTDYADRYGEVEFLGQSYALSAQVRPTHREFAGSISCAAEGEQCTVEYAAPAVDKDGEDYLVCWRFNVVKGAEPDADTHNWGDAYTVVPA